MYSFSALIYDGRRQHLIAGEFDSSEQFNRHLENTYGIHVCLWQSQNTAHHIAQKINSVQTHQPSHGAQ